MHIVILIEIIVDPNSNDIIYETIDTFIQLYDDNELLEIKIMKKYPTLNYIHNCDNNIVVYDKFTKQKYLITSIYV
jgi:hypothetical protein